MFVCACLSPRAYDAAAMRMKIFIVSVHHSTYANDNKVNWA